MIYQPGDLHSTLIEFSILGTGEVVASGSGDLDGYGPINGQQSNFSANFVLDTSLVSFDNLSFYNSSGSSEPILKHALISNDFIKSGRVNYNGLESNVLDNSNDFLSIECQEGSSYEVYLGFNVVVPTGATLHYRIGGNGFYRNEPYTEESWNQAEDPLGSFLLSIVQGAGIPYLNSYSGFLVGGGIDNLDINPVPAPEPASLLLLGSGLIGFAGFRRKFKK
jgi:hypothetical protein